MARTLQPIEKLDRKGIERRVDELVRELGAKTRADAFRGLDRGKYKGRKEALTLAALRYLVA
jgi:hypothetical protein